MGIVGSRWLWLACLGALLTLSGAAVRAGDLTASWKNATQNTDGTPIPASGDGSLTSSEVEYGTCNSGGGFGTRRDSHWVAGTPVPETWTFTDVPPDSYCVRVRHLNTYNESSAWSAVAQGTVEFVPPVPNPPTMLTVATVAYQLNYRWGETVLGKAVGTVPLGAACDETMVVRRGSKKLYYIVDRSTVTFSKYWGGEVVAQCAPSA